MTTRLVVLIARHGERIDHVEPSWLDNAEVPDDPPLTRRGVLMAQELGASLSGRRLALVLSSPFTRCVQTACAAADEVRLETGICEWLDAEWYPDGDPLPKLPSAAQHRARGLNVVEGTPRNVAFPEPQGDPDLYDTELPSTRRCEAVIDELKAQWRNGALPAEDDGSTTVLLVAHGGICPLLGCACVEDEASRARILHAPVDYCALTECVLTDDGGSRLVRCGDTSFLADLKRRFRDDY